MSFFLKVVFACLIAIGIAAILAVVAAVVFFKKLCAEGFTEDTPYAIHLNEDLHPEWLEKPKAKNLIAELQQSGFTAGKAYVIDELNYAKLHSYFNGDYAAVVYEIEVLGGCFFDLVHFGKDDFAVTVSTMPTAGDFEMPPNKLIFGFEQLTIKEGLEILDENCRNRESIVLNNENFRETFEHYYRQEQIFRNRNGGISYEEFKKITQNKTLFKGKKFKEDKLREVYLEQKVDELDRWNYASIDEYHEKNNSKEDEIFDEHLFLVPNKTSPSAFVQYLGDHGLLTDGQIDHYKNAVNDDDNVVELFNNINSSRSPELRAIEKCSVEFPVVGSLYKIPSNYG